MEVHMKNREYTDDKRESGTIALRGNFWRWLDNFWYHHKWVTVGVAFALLVVIICTVQMCGKEKNDLTVVYAGRNQLSPAESQNFSQVLESICPEDFDENGEKQIAVGAYCILSEEQILELQRQAAENDEQAYFDQNYNSTQYDTFMSYLMTGESSVLFLDPWLYNMLRENGRLAKLESVLGYVPEGAYGEYGVKLSETELYKDFGVVRLMPGDTVICILEPYVVGKSSKEKYYDWEKQMFEAIVEYAKED